MPLKSRRETKSARKISQAFDLARESELRYDRSAVRVRFNSGLSFEGPRDGEGRAALELTGKMSSFPRNLPFSSSMRRASGSVSLMRESGDVWKAANIKMTPRPARMRPSSALNQSENAKYGIMTSRYTTPFFTLETPSCVPSAAPHSAS